MNPETHIGQYKIVRTLGAGGMGTVYLGEHLLLGRRAAIKTLLPALSIHREIVDRFFTEARAISAISDPGVVQIFDFGYHVDGTAFIVMEYLEGESLDSRLARLHKLSLVEALRLGKQLASSLYAAHHRGIIHRDLKPANIFVVRDSETQGGERTKILDFGVCKLTGARDASSTEAGTMIGTPVYMSPEQCRAAGDVDARSDIYALGSVLFHMLTGRPPFDCESVGEFIAAHLKDEPQPPSTIEPSVRPAVDEIVMRCLAKNPDDRYQTARDLQGAIEDVIATLSDPGRVVIPTLEHDVALGEGFRSDFDVNEQNHAAERPERWFVDSKVPVPAAPPGDSEHAWEPPEKGLSLKTRAAIVFLVFAALLGGLALTSASLTKERKEPTAGLPPALPVGSITPPAKPPTPTPPPAIDLVPDAGLPPPVAAEPPIEPELGADEPAKAPTEALPEPPASQEKQAKPERPASNRKWRPRPRRHVSDEDSTVESYPDAPVTQPQSPPVTQPQPPSQPSTQEDLYDTR